MTLLVTLPVFAQTYDQHFDKQAEWNKNLLFSDKLNVIAEIPQEYQGCSIDSAEWTLYTSQGGQITSQTWSKFVTTLNNLDSDPTWKLFKSMWIVEDSKHKKVVQQYDNLVNPFSGEKLVAFFKVAVDATYKCNGSNASANDSSNSGGESGKNPDPPCTEKEWCLDVDGDGYGSLNYKSIWSCNQPEPFEAETTCKGFGSFKKCYASKFHAYMPNCNDACDDNSNQHEFKKWYWDGDMDKKGELETSWYSLGGYSCGPPAGKKGKKGQWVNETGDACDDLYGVFEKKTWWWDQDKDNNGDINSKQTVCVKPKDKKNKSPWKEGRWLLVGGDWCDEDPGNTDKKYWYWDGDFDGVGSEITSDKYQKPVFGCKPGIPNPSGQWVTKKGDECNDNKIPAHKSTKKKQEYFLDKDGDGVPSLSKKSKPFCTDEEAKKENYVPKAYKKTPAPLKRRGTEDVAIEPLLRISDPRTSDPRHHAGDELTREVPQEIWDECDDNDKVSEFIVLYNDADEDGFGSGEAMHLCKEPSSDALVAEMGNDCDDDDPDIKDHFFVYRDWDKDGFGHPDAVKKIACNDDLTLESYNQDKKEGWVTNKADLGDFLHSSSPFLNLSDNLGKLFVMTDDFTASNTKICSFRQGLTIECLPKDIFQHLCEASNQLQDFGALPIIDTLPPGIIQETFSHNAIVDCLVKPWVGYAFFSHGGHIFLATQMLPIGRMIIPVIGNDFSVFLGDATAEITTTAKKITFSAMQVIKPYIRYNLAEIPGPLPIAYTSASPPPSVEDGPVSIKRRILVKNRLGPELSFKISPKLIKNVFNVEDFLISPLIYITAEKAEGKAITEEKADGMAIVDDTDLDYLPDFLENEIGSDPMTENTDDDWAPDAAEFLWSGFQAEPVLDDGLVPSLRFLSDGSLAVIQSPMLKPQELVILEKAKIMAADLMPKVVDQLSELYGKKISLVYYPEIVEQRIATTRPASLKKFLHDPALMEEADPDKTNLATPFSGLTDGSWAGWCNADEKEVCVNIPAIKNFYNGYLPSQTLVSVLLIFNLYHIFSVPDDIDHKLKFEIIESILGTINNSGKLYMYAPWEDALTN